MKPVRAVNVLLIEDNPGDVRLTLEALREGRINVVLHVAADGVEAMQFLKKEEGYEKVPLPDLIFLDLNLPRKDGRTLLGEIKSDPQLRQIPVVVLTTSNAEEDIQKTYHLHANSYINKPVDFDRFFEVIQKVEEFWLSTVTLPSMAD